MSRGQLIYYVGPTPARPGKPIGSAGPTTSYRMDSYAPTLHALGLKGIIGKGSRSKEVREALKKHKAVYLAVVGGAGALISKSIVGSEVVAYPELGPEADHPAQGQGFPVHRHQRHVRRRPLRGRKEEISGGIENGNRLRLLSAASCPFTLAQDRPHSARAGRHRLRAIRIDRRFYSIPTA